jgi:hypothetical protein
MLGELPMLEEFDIALLIKMDRQTVVEASPFVFFDTPLNQMDDRSFNTFQPVELLRNNRPDLRWFTDLCAPHAAYRSFSYMFNDFNRRLWIVDTNPALPYMLLA